MVETAVEDGELSLHELNNEGGPKSRFPGHSNAR